VIGPSGRARHALRCPINMLEGIRKRDIAIDGEAIGYRIEAGKIPFASSPSPLFRVRFPAGAEPMNGSVSLSAGACPIGPMVFQSYKSSSRHRNRACRKSRPPGTGETRCAAASRARERAILAMVWLADKVAEYPIRLSGGQQKRAHRAGIGDGPQDMMFGTRSTYARPRVVGEVLAAMQQLAGVE